MPVVVVRRGNIGPSAAGERAEDARVRDELGKLLSGARGEEVEESDKGEAGTWSLVLAGAVSCVPPVRARRVRGAMELVPDVRAINSIKNERSG